MAPRDSGLLELAIGTIAGINDTFLHTEVFRGPVSIEAIELPRDLRSLAPDGPSHLLCIADGTVPRAGLGMMFGPDFLIEQTAVVALYDPPTQRIRCFHCVKCARLALDWLKGQQSEWVEVFSSRLDESEGQGPGRTYQ